jgi:hypothetical protein
MVLLTVEVAYGLRAAIAETYADNESVTNDEALIMSGERREYKCGSGGPP